MASGERVPPRLKPGTALFARENRRPGDRSSPCGALMAPIGLDHHPAKGWMITHRCTACGHTGRNHVADQSDDVDALASLSTRH